MMMTPTPPPQVSSAAAPAPGVDDARYLAQRRAAWDAILQRHGADTVTAADPMSVLPAPLLHHQDVMDSGERPISMSELPPPPDFLLDNAGPPELQLMKTCPVGGKVFDGRTAPAAAAPLLFEVSDGYRSADSVDDDIDDVDYTIRQPTSTVIHAHLL